MIETLSSMPAGVKMGKSDIRCILLCWCFTSELSPQGLQKLIDAADKYASEMV